jgi:hypothetical protein
VAVRLCRYAWTRWLKIVSDAGFTVQETPNLILRNVLFMSLPIGALLLLGVLPLRFAPGSSHLHANTRQVGSIRTVLGAPLRLYISLDDNNLEGTSL